MMCMRPDIACKLESINKFIVAVSLIWKMLFFENFSSFPLYEESFFGNHLHFIGFFVPRRPFGKVICLSFEDLGGKNGFLITLCIR